MIPVRQGSRGCEVMYLQRLLNKNGASPQLREDGRFGLLTHAALVAFQTTSHMTPANGVTTPAILAAPGEHVDIEHRIRLYSQPTGMTCWSASMTMMRGTNMSIGSGGATLGASGGLTTTEANISIFAQQNGLRIITSMQSIPVGQFVAMVRRGPVPAIGSGRGTGTSRRAHACVLSGIYSDDVPDGSGTMMRIHDPWPVPTGLVYGVFYTGGNQWTPNGTYDLFGCYYLQ